MDKLNWDEAEEKLENAEKAIKTTKHHFPQINIGYYKGIVASYRERYDSGERSERLHDNIMELKI